MSPPRSADTKLVISSYHRFTLWRSPPEMAEAVRKIWPEMRVLDLPHYDRITVGQITHIRALGEPKSHGPCEEGDADSPDHWKTCCH